MTHCFSQSDQSLPGWGWIIKLCLFSHFIYLSYAHKSVADVVSMLFAFQCKIDTDLIIVVYESVPIEPHDIKSLLNQSSSSSFKTELRNSDLCRWFVKVMAAGIRLNHGCTSTDTAMRHSIHFFFHFSSYMDMLSSSLWASPVMCHSSKSAWFRKLQFCPRIGVELQIWRGNESMSVTDACL